MDADDVELIERAAGVAAARWRTSPFHPDLRQAALIAAWRALGSWSGQGSREGWVAAKARWAVTDEVRRLSRGRWNRHLGPVLTEVSPEQLVSDDGEWLNWEDLWGEDDPALDGVLERIAVADGMAAMTTSQRRTFLAVLDCGSGKDAADRLGVTEAAVSYALKRCRAKVAAAGEDGDS